MAHPTHPSPHLASAGWRLWDKGLPSHANHVVLFGTEFNPLHEQKM